MTVLLVLACEDRNCATHNKDDGKNKFVEFVHVINILINNKSILFPIS